MRLPDDSKRHVIIGRNGSGKTQYGLWSASGRSFTSKPWIIFDFKGDKIIERIENEAGAKVIDLSKPPTKKGLYIVRPLPKQEKDVDAFLWQVWQNERTGLFFDEGYMVSDGEAFRAILTQGRSKEVPAIVLSQRPVWMTRFVWSEADFFNVFKLSVLDDRKRVREFVPYDVKAELPQYHSFYYDVGDDRLSLMLPVPGEDAIVKVFKDRLAGNRRFL